MSKQVNVHEAKTNFSKLIAAVEAGEEIIVARAGTPILKLVKIEQELPPLVPGFAKDIVPELTDEEWDEMKREIAATFVEKEWDR